MLIANPPVALTDNLLMLGTAPYPIYLLKGQNEGAIFEGGIGPMGPVLREQLAELDIAGEYIKQVILAHGHPDHVMAVPEFRQMFDPVSVAASEITAKTLSSEKAIGFFCKMDDALSGSLREVGVIGPEHTRSPLAENCITVDRILKEGDTITVDELTVDVLETPGHSDCSLSFHQPEEKFLIISDASGYYLPEQDDWWPNYFGSYASYLSSMRRLADLGAETLCLSHNGVIQGADEVRAYFDRAIAATEAYHRRIVEETQAGKSVRQIAETLGSEAYEKTPLLPLEFFQKNCSFLVKQSLKHEGIGEEGG